MTVRTMSRPIVCFVAAGCLLAGTLEASHDGLSLGPWREVKPLPTGVSMHAMVTVGDHLYVIGGRAGADWHTVKAQVFHSRIREGGILEAWRRTTPLPQALGGHVAMAVGCRIYVVSGRGHGSDNIMKTPVTFVGTVTSDGGISGWRTGPALPKDK